MYYKIEVDRIQRNVDGLLKEKNRILIGIDGCGGSGKSTLARELSIKLQNVPIVPMDDFFLPSHGRKLSSEKTIGWQFDWQRLEKEVLGPLHLGLDTKYQRYDWSKDRLSGWNEVKCDPVVIIEGVYILRTELSRYYSLRIWVDCPAEIRLKRGLERDGEGACSLWVDDWMKEEDRYIREHQPQKKAEIIILGSLS